MILLSIALCIVLMYLGFGLYDLIKLAIDNQALLSALIVPATMVYLYRRLNAFWIKTKQFFEQVKKDIFVIEQINQIKTKQQIDEAQAKTEKEMELLRMKLASVQSDINKANRESDKIKPRIDKLDAGINTLMKILKDGQERTEKE